MGLRCGVEWGVTDPARMVSMVIKTIQTNTSKPPINIHKPRFQKCERERERLEDLAPDVSRPCCFHRRDPRSPLKAVGPSPGIRETGLSSAANRDSSSTQA